MKKLFTILILLGVTAFGQTTFSWRSESANGLWNWNDNWHNGSSNQAPQGGDILFFNNNTNTSMTNDLPAGTMRNRHKIIFGVNASTSRNILGTGENSFFDYSGVWPFIQNLSSVNHTIGFPLKGSPSVSLEIRPQSGDLTISGDVNNNGQSIILYAPDGSTKSSIFSGVISGGGKFIVKNGILGKISGPSTFTGDVEIDKGEFWLQNGATLGAGTVYIGNSGATADVTKMWLDDADGGTTSSRGIVINQGNANTRYLGGLTSSGINTYSGSITVNSSNGLIVDVPTVDVSLEMSGSLSGSKIIKSGLGNVLLSGTSNSFTANLEVDQGELWLKPGYSLGVGTIYIGNGTQLANVAKLWIDDADGGTIISRNIVINSGNTTTRYIGGLNSTGTNTFSGTITINSTNGLIVDIPNGGNVELSGIISGTAGSGMAKTGSGKLLLTGANTYSGWTTLDAGTLQLGTGGTFGTGSEVYIKNGATLDLNDISTTVKLVAEGSSPGGTVDLGSATLTISGGFEGIKYQNSITGSGNLEKKGSGTMALYGTQDFSGTITVEGGTLSTVVSLSASTITVKTGATFSVTDNISVNDLIIEAGGILTIADGKTLTINSGKNLTLNDKVTLGTGNIVLAGIATMTESATNYIITNSSGTLTRTVGASQVIFPIGIDASNYNPVTITNSGISRAFAVKAKSTPTNPGYNGKYVNCFWNVTPDGVGVNGTLVFQWNAAQEDPSFTRGDATLHIGRWTGTVWDPKLATLGGSGPYTATATGFTNFSEFGVGSNGALPVELTSFNAAIRNGLVDLKWETATEVNNNGFEVERKTANADWSKIGFVEGHGMSNSPKYYSFSDKPVGTGKIAYRLKQIDNDGQFEYSPVVEVLVDNLPNGFVMEQNYPNPFNPETSIRFALKEDTKATLKVFNTMGELVTTLFDGIAEAGRYYDVKFNGNDLSSGFYIYKLVAGDHVAVKKMLLMK